MQRYVLSGKHTSRLSGSCWLRLAGNTCRSANAATYVNHTLFRHSFHSVHPSYSYSRHHRLSGLTSTTRLSSVELPLSHYAYVSSPSHLFIFPSSSFATASSLGTPDPPEESKAGAPRTPSSPHTGSLGASDGSVVAGERQMPVAQDDKQQGQQGQHKQSNLNDHVKQLLSKDGTVRLTPDEIAKLEAVLDDKAVRQQQQHNQQYMAAQQAAPAVHQTGAPLPLGTAPPASLGAPPFPTTHFNTDTTAASPPAPTSAPSSSSSSSPLAAPASLSSPALTNKNTGTPFLLPPAPPTSPLIRGVLWFDCVYPMQAHWLDPRHLLATHNHETLIPTIMPADVEILSMIPRIKEGGVFVQFEAKKGDQYETAHDVSLAVIRRLRKKPVRARFTTRPVHCHLVAGEPFLEDLMSRFPSARLKIEMKGSDVACKEVTLEHLFGELRSFGRIIDLILGPYVKDQPRQASVQYRKMHGAVGARQCLHRSLIVVQPPPATVGASPPAATSLMLFFTYDSVLKTSYIIDFANKHPRIVVPLMGLILAAFTILIFDPLRSFNITNKITGRFTIRGLTHSGPLVFLRTQLTSLWHHRIFDVFKHESSETVVRSTWSAREADEEKVNRWLHSIPDRLLFITGAKGAGKQALVRKVTADRHNVVTINFGQFIDRADEEFVKGLSNAIGFAPGFSILSWISNIMDIFTPGAGKASGAGTAQFTSQLQKILEVWTDALVAIDSRATKRIKSTADGQVSVTEEKHRSDEVRDKVMELVKSGEATSHPNSETGSVADKNKPVPTGKGVEAGDKKEQSKEDTSNNSAESGTINTDKITEKVGEAAARHLPVDRSLYSDTIPLFVIDGFSPDNKDKHANFMSSFVQFAAQMTAAQLGRFLFLTDSTLEESISKSMPDVKVQEVTLSDADVESAMEFVMNSVSGSMKDKMTDEMRWETKRAVRILGGRYSDLLSLVRQLESGASPMDAAEEIVNQSIGIVKSILFTDSKTAWNKTQLWLTMGMLADSYDRSLKAEEAEEQQAEEEKEGVKEVEEESHAQHPHAKESSMRDWIGYDDCLFIVFGGDDAALRGLVRADILRIEGRLNEQDRLRAGSPVLLEAMRRMRQQEKFKAGMDVLVAKSTIDKEQKRLSELEDDLVRVGRLENEYVEQARRSEAVYGAHHRFKGWFGLGGESEEEVQRRLFREEMAGRRAYLLACLSESHEKITKADAQKRQCEATIKRMEM